MTGKGGAAEAETAARIGRYRIAFELASGGMATMYLARAEGPGGFEKLAALKRIHPHLAKDPAFVEMFFDEARIASRVAHPNVCSVFEFGQADGAYFIAMDYVHGETLGRVLKRLAGKPALLREPSWPLLAARIVAEAAEGLHAAHELKDDKGALLGVVHRDVSPQNLFVAYDGTIRVVDFGVASAEGRLHQTQAGTVKGKLAYLAPEQARRKPIDRRVDVWALGVVLWETLVAKRLFQRGTDAETILASATDDVPAPSSVRAWIPKELDAIVLKALARDRDARYATARDLARDLHRFVSRAPEPVTSHDLADWMAAEFTREKAERERWIEQSRTASHVTPPRVAAIDPSGAEVEAFDPEVDLVSEDASKISPIAEPEHTTQTPAPFTDTSLSLDAEAPAAVSAQAPVAVAAPAPVAVAAPAAPTRSVAHETDVEPAVDPSGVQSIRATSAEASAEAASVETSAAPASGEAPAASTPFAPLASPIPIPPLSLPELRSDADGVGLPSSKRPIVALVAAGVGIALTAGLVLVFAGSGPSTPTAVPLPHVAAPIAVPVAPEVVAPEAVTPEVVTPEVVTPEIAPPAAPAVVVPSAEVAHHAAPPVVSRAPRGTGTLSIATPGGWADVYLGDRQLGRAPGQVVVPAGRSVLRLLPFGHEPSRRVVVQVEADGTSRVVVPVSQ